MVVESHVSLTHRAEKRALEGIPFIYSHYLGFKSK